MSTILLFDVDGTLITTNGAGRTAFDAAFRDEFGPDHGLLDFSFAGMTDPLIVRRGLEAAGRPVTPETTRQMVDAYLSRLADTLESTAGYRVHPGVPDLLGKLEGNSRLAVGLGTGNHERGARIKLEPGGLNDHFAFGGFGSDAEDRAELLAVGARRGAAAVGRDVDDCRVVVIGDTPRDIDAAHAIGARSIAVATGSGYDADELEQAGPDVLLENLADARVLEVLRVDS